MKTSTQHMARWVRAAGVVAVSASMIALAACSSGGGTGTTDASTQTDSGGKITVWVDPPRVPAAEAFKKAHPEIPIAINQIDGTVGNDQLKQQFAQFNQAGKGWPDAIFFPTNDSIAWAAGPQIHYTADLGKLLPDVVKGYATNSIEPCNIDGKIQCLRNDIAPDVFWYNKPFFEKNHYAVPTTWEDYADLAVRIKKEHPEMTSGFLGDAYAPDRYLWAANCATNDKINDTTVHININEPDCLRMKTLLTKVVDAKAVSTLGIFDADAAAVGKNIAMTPGAPWYGDYLFKQTWKIPAATMTATPALAWKGDSKPSAGDEGGGLWGVSSHIKGKELENTLTFATFVASDPAWQVELSTGLPAYGPVQDAWIAKQKQVDYFADPDATFSAMKGAIENVLPDHPYMLYITGGIWTQEAVPALVSGQGVDAAWAAFGKELTAKATSLGYTVKDSQ
ncbi:ABC transporter substrate-binding protein [Microbacterium terrisoli]|uniref:ABC transporter substrate-binding protein n=1 Tax=Microbacterium terrisoli TaxID=3242192 RepID=UPI00280634D7|nr:ABC transporter substrate-binding protein [Microbacterium protaetiae]